MVPYRGSPRPGVLHSRVRLKRSNLNEQVPQRWGEVTEQKQWVAAVLGTPALHPVVPLPVGGLWLCFWIHRYSCFALAVNVDKKLGGSCAQTHVFTFLIVTWLAAFRPRSVLGWNRIWKQIAKISPTQCGLISVLLTSQNSLSFHWSVLSTFPLSGTKVLFIHLYHVRGLKEMNHTTDI